MVSSPEREPRPGTNGGFDSSHPGLGVVALRTETGWVSPADTFCAVCDCFKSGWADRPNKVAEWCESLGCPCHGEKSLDAG